MSIEGNVTSVTVTKAGPRGAAGWSPLFSVVTDGERRVLQVDDWTGSTGTKPSVGAYLGDTGLVDDIEDATDLRGAAGVDSDMIQSVYDTNGDGTVDAADTVPWTGVQDAPDFLPKSGGVMTGDIVFNETQSFPAAGGWTQIGDPIGLTGATVTITDIPQTFAELRLSFVGAQHNAGGGFTTISFDASNDNGSNFATSRVISGNIVASADFVGDVIIANYSTDQGSLVATLGAVAGSLGSIDVVPKGIAFQWGGGMNALRLSLASGAFIAGSVTVEGL